MKTETEVNVQNMTFSTALVFLKQGARIARTGWNGRNMWLRYVPAPDWALDTARFPEELGIAKLPWIGMKTADCKFVPWLASQTDILAEDWWVLPPSLPKLPDLPPVA